MRPLRMGFGGPASATALASLLTELSSAYAASGDAHASTQAATLATEVLTASAPREFLKMSLHFGAVSAPAAVLPADTTDATGAPDPAAVSAELTREQARHRVQQLRRALRRAVGG